MKRTAITISWLSVISPFPFISLLFCFLIYSSRQVLKEQNVPVALKWHTYHHLYVMDKQIEIASIHSVRPTTPWLHTCRYQNQHVSWETLSQTHTRSAGGVDLLSDVCVQMNLFAFSLINGKGHFPSSLAIKIQGLYKIASWRRRFAMSGCHVYPPSPKVSYWQQWMDFWDKNGWNYICSTIVEFRRGGLSAVFHSLRFDGPRD